jgi:hypothetical protein
MQRSRRSLRQLHVLICRTFTATAPHNRRRPSLASVSVCRGAAGGRARPSPSPPFRKRSRSVPLPVQDFLLAARRTLETVHRVALAVPLLLLAASACWGNEQSEPTSASPSGADLIAPLETLSGQSQGATLKMAPGRSVARFRVSALDPPTHVFDVRIIAPASADVGVWMRTAPPPSRLLHVLDSTRLKDWCKVRSGRSVCKLTFPELEAQREGPWTVIVRKRSEPAARVKVGVTFRSA